MKIKTMYIVGTIKDGKFKQADSWKGSVQNNRLYSSLTRAKEIYNLNAKGTETREPKEVHIYEFSEVKEINPEEEQ